MDLSNFSDITMFFPIISDIFSLTCSFWAGVRGKAVVTVISAIPNFSLHNSEKAVQILSNLSQRLPSVITQRKLYTHLDSFSPKASLITDIFSSLDTVGVFISLTKPSVPSTAVLTEFSSSRAEERFSPSSFIASKRAKE